MKVVDVDSLLGLPGLSRRISVNESGCWVYGSASSYEYGRIRVVPGGKQVPAHRAVFAAVHGPIGDGMEIHHVCRTKRCVNPAHLQQLTQSEHFRIHNPLAHCKHGHEMTSENVALRLRRDGYVRRCCRTCERIWGRRNDDRRRPKNRSGEAVGLLEGTRAASSEEVIIRAD